MTMYDYLKKKKILKKKKNKQKDFFWKIKTFFQMNCLFSVLACACNAKMYIYLIKKKLSIYPAIKCSISRILRLFRFCYLTIRVIEMLSCLSRIAHL